MGSTPFSSSPQLWCNVMKPSDPRLVIAYKRRQRTPHDNSVAPDQQASGVHHMDVLMHF